MDFKNKVNSLIIIGNGFDLYLGLRSSFPEFLNIFNRLESNLNNLYYNVFNKINREYNDYKYKGHTIDANLIMRFIDNIRIDNIPQVTPLPSSKSKSKKNLDVIASRVSKSLGKLIHDNNHINFWIMYLFMKKDEGYKNWSSIESQIYHLLENDNNNDDMQNILASLFNSCNINNNFEFSGTKRSRLLAYLMVYVFSYHGDSVLRELRSNSNKINVNNNKLKDIFLRFLKTELYDFEYNLNNYLFSCLSRYEKIYGSSYYKVGANILKCLATNKSFSLLNFNYTNPAKYFKDNDKNNELHNIRNIHGRLTHSDLEYDKTKSPIIGISDHGIDIMSKLYSFTKNYRIMELSYNNYNDILKDNVNQIVFFGHSFDAADYSYFFDIFDRYNIYNINDTSTKLIFYYVPYGNQTPFKGSINQINNIDRLFKNYCQYRHKSIDPRVLLHILSFEGRLIIDNFDTHVIINNFGKSYSGSIMCAHYISNALNDMDSLKYSSKDISNKIDSFKCNIENAKGLINNDSLTDRYNKLLTFIDENAETDEDERENILKGFRKYILKLPD